MPVTNAAERRAAACADDCGPCARASYLLKGPCALQVEAKANIALTKLNYESKIKKQTTNVRESMHDDGGKTRGFLNCVDYTRVRAQLISV